MRNTFCLVLWLVLAWGAPAAAAPVFEAGAPGPQARDAVAYLVARGVIEGFPGGAFKGDRALSRYELTKLLDRLESPETEAASRLELGGLEDTVQSLQRELQALGGRVRNDEASVDQTEERLDHLDRP